MEIRVPIRSHASAYRKVERRVGDWAVVAAGAVLLGDLRRGHRRGGIGLTAVGARRFVAEQAEDFLRGGRPDAEGFTEAGRIAAQECRPTADQRGRGRLQAASGGELTTRALRAAAARAQGQERDMRITVTVNGEQYTEDVEPRLLYVHFLDELGLTGTHWGCDTCNCGVCTVWLDGTPVKSCTVLAVMADGHEVRTVEGLAHGAELEPGATGIHRLPRPAVPLLHAGDDDDGTLAARPRRGSVGGGHPRGHLRTDVHCATRTSCAPSAGPPSTAVGRGLRTQTRTPSRGPAARRCGHDDHRGTAGRLRTDAPQGGRAVRPRPRDLRRRRTAAPGCCTARSCAAHWPTPGSCPSTPAPPRRTRRSRQ